MNAIFGLGGNGSLVTIRNENPDVLIKHNINIVHFLILLKA